MFVTQVGQCFCIALHLVLPCPALTCPAMPCHALHCPVAVPSLPFAPCSALFALRASGTACLALGPMLVTQLSHTAEMVRGATASQPVSQPSPAQPSPESVCERDVHVVDPLHSQRSSIVPICPLSGPLSGPLSMHPCIPAMSIYRSPPHSGLTCSAALQLCCCRSAS
ncbi:MAG: hypothetical protein J3Q66DRAFT_94117 [Benniella sp.]|nr:MAG: hypothetical protein J3Q66DRAFT_94117 [Benniella sp.]